MTQKELQENIQRVDAKITTNSEAIKTVNALSHYTDKVDMDPDQLQQLEERLNLLHSLKRKYGATIQAMIAFGEEAAQKLPVKMIIPVVGLLLPAMMLIVVGPIIVQLYRTFNQFYR